MRGGTSRGPFFLEEDLPVDPEERDRFLLAAMGSPHVLQVNGIGGGNPMTSKVAIVARSSRPGADVDYLFAQVATDRAFVDFSPNCGNMLSAVGPFAIEAGLVPAQVGETTVRIFNRNTATTVEAVVKTPAGVVDYEGETAIDGVPGTAAPVKLTFLDAVGSKTGAFLPTGHVREFIDNTPVTLIDYAMPMVLLRAGDLGMSGDETPDELEANNSLLARLETIRLEAGLRMGLGDVSGSVVPKIGILSSARHGGTITSRYFMNSKRCHKGHAVTGALCIAAACRLPGSVAHDLAASELSSLVNLEHPSGRIEIDLSIDASGQIARASLVRTARRIFEGKIIVPASAVIAPLEGIQQRGENAHDHHTPTALLRRPSYVDRDHIAP
ncbi:4-oxalomesaconate tautomerase [Microvirga sp. VF16]|uniref:4-oxalomesaconate tautomerase n=1 Tax=Microvirga sp. VF16 TaxID=2807101 RepID=UPI00193C9A0A|nr:4-oxalomesaconate tautomerase [Microvirga sp. VF16]QRM31852.1 4-oxalomesaconate tautomerase [Microvirga sp. VF16]